MKLREQFRKATGITYDIDKVIENIPEDDKEAKQKLFNKIAWQSPGGGINLHGRNAETIGNFLVNLAEALDVDITNADINGDGKIDSSDDRIFSKIEVITKSDDKGETPDPDGPTEPEEPEEPKEEVADGTVLWGDFFGDEGNDNSSFDSAVNLSEYNYSGIEGYKDNTNVKYTGNGNVRLSTGNSGSTTSGHLWFNKNVEGVFETFDINLYDVKNLTFGYSKTGAKCSVSYFDGSEWKSIVDHSASQTGQQNVQFSVEENVNSIKIKIEHNDGSNLRVDNIRLVAGNVNPTVIEELIAKYTV